MFNLLDKLRFLCIGVAALIIFVAAYFFDVNPTMVASILALGLAADVWARVHILGAYVLHTKKGENNDSKTDTAV